MAPRSLSKLQSTEQQPSPNEINYVDASLNDEDFAGISSLPIEVEDSQSQHKYLAKPPKRFPTMSGPHAISEMDLGMNFAYQRKAPDRLGQYSQRPLPAEQHMNLVTPVQGKLDPCSPVTSKPGREEPSPAQPPSARQRQDYQALPRGQCQPLQIPELAGLDNCHQQLFEQKECETSSRTEISRSSEPLVGLSEDSKEQSLPPVEPQSYQLPPLEPTERREHVDHSQQGDRASVPNGSPFYPFSSDQVIKPSTLHQSSPVASASGEQYMNATQTVSHKPQLAHSGGLGYRGQKNPPVRPCGDLEGPGYQRTPSHQVISSTQKSPGSGRATFTSPGRVPSDLLRDQSHSRASNISRKREGITKSYARGRRDADRKRDAMKHVARYWNECMVIAEEENTQARRKIEMLQSNAHHWEKKAKESSSALREKVRQIKTVQATCTQLQDSEAQWAENAKALGGEIELLRQQEANSKRHVTSIQQRANKYREKVDEAIAEQHRLINHYRHFCEATTEELKEARQRPGINQAEVERALISSAQNREEMKHCFEKQLAAVEEKNREQNHLLEGLSEKVQSKDCELEQSTKVINALREQLLHKRHTQETLEQMQHKIERLADRLVLKDDAENAQLQLHAELCAKFDNLAEQIQGLSVSANQVNRQPWVEYTQARVMEQILPIIQTMASKQQDDRAALASLAENVNQGFDSIQKQQELHALADATGATQASENHRAIIQLVEDLQHTVRSNEAACKDVSSELRAQASRTAEEGHNTANTLHQNLFQQLQDRDEKVGELQRQLQLTTEDYAAKLQVYANTLKLGESSSVSQEWLQRISQDLAEQLDRLFQREGTASRSKLREMEDAMQLLNQELEETKARLVERETLTSEQGWVPECLEKERATSEGLRSQLKQLQEDAKVTQQLHKKWQTDIRSVKAVRSLLAVIRDKVPRYEQLAAKLDSISGRQDVLKQTAKYLSTEHDWVRSQLQVRGVPQRLAAHPQEVPERMVGRGCPQLVSIQDENAPKDKSLLPAAIEVEVPKQVISARVNTVNQIERGPTFPKSQDDGQFRKVQVHSPVWEAEIPLQHVSVREEQVNRRMAVRPRSIMKDAATAFKPAPLRPSQDSGGQTSLLANSANHSQYNRRVVGSGAPSGVDSTMMRGKIRSSLIGASGSLLDWKLPTVDQFEHAGQTTAGNHNDSFSKREFATLNQQERVVSKRPRLEDNHIAVSKAAREHMVSKDVKQEGSNKSPLLQKDMRMQSRKVSE